MASKLIIKNNLNSELQIAHKDNEPAKQLNTGDFKYIRNTVNELASIIPSGATLSDYDGQVCFIKDLDRGGSFIYDSTKVADSNDGTNFSGWIRQYDNIVDIRWFGAKSTTEVGYETFDSTSQIQSALDLQLNISLGRGKYNVSSELLVYPNTTLFGESTEKTQLRKTTNSTNTDGEDCLLNLVYKQMPIYGREAALPHEIKIHSFLLERAGSNTAQAGNAIYSKDLLFHVYIENMQMNAFTNAIYFFGSFLSTLSKISARGTFRLQGTNSTSLTMTDCYSYGHSAEGYVIKDYGYTSLVSCACDFVDKTAYYINGGNLSLISCGCESLSTNIQAKVIYAENAQVFISGFIGANITATSSGFSAIELVNAKVHMFDSYIWGNPNVLLAKLSGATTDTYKSYLVCHDASTDGVVFDASILDDYSEFMDVRGTLQRIYKGSAGSNIQNRYGQIGFPSVPVLSSNPNTLDRYEEGSVTVTATVSTGTITLSANTLNYTKIGNVVHVNGTLVVSAVSSPTGVLIISGLPYTLAPGNAGVGAFSVYGGGFASTINSLQSKTNTSNELLISSLSGGAVLDIAKYIKAGTFISISGSIISST